MSKTDESDIFYPNDIIGKYVIESPIITRSKNHLYKAYVPPNAGKQYYVIKLQRYKTLVDKLIFDQEQQVLQKLSDFKFILTPIELIEQKPSNAVDDESGEEMTFMCVVMNFCNYFDLRDFYYHYVKRTNKLELRLPIFFKTLTILKHIHDRRIVHCDIKPQNFLVREIQPLDIVLSDFEFATQLKEGCFINKRHGTCQYMAPEVICGQDYDMAADIWSFGVMMYTLSRNKYPFGIESSDKISEVYNKITHNKLSFGKCFPRPLGYLIIKMLQIDPAKRITAAKALKHTYFKDYSEIEEATKARISEISDIQAEEIEADKINRGQIEGES